VHCAGRARRALRLGLDAVHGDDVDALVGAVTADAAADSAKAA
jgi:hypothetical protein